MPTTTQGTDAATSGNIAAALRDPIIRPREVSQLTGLTLTTLGRLRTAGKFPMAIQLGPRSIGWPLSVIKEWIQSRELIA